MLLIEFFASQVTEVPRLKKKQHGVFSLRSRKNSEPQKHYIAYRYLENSPDV